MAGGTADLRPLVDVAVGVLRRGDGALLFAQRPEGKPYAGWWEFPGGKVESGETVMEALERELHEELGIMVEPGEPLEVVEFPTRTRGCAFIFWWSPAGKVNPLPARGRRSAGSSPQRLR